MDDRTITMTVGHDRLATVGSDRRLLNMLRIPGQKKWEPKLPFSEDKLFYDLYHVILLSDSTKVFIS